HTRHSYSSFSLFFPSSRTPRDLHSFPTRRSSDLPRLQFPPEPRAPAHLVVPGHPPVRQRRAPPVEHLQGQLVPGAEADRRRHPGDRKSTRLNSSHSQISYAVFCLKKKKKKKEIKSNYTLAIKKNHIKIPKP